jgi:hypothetical protein
MQTHRLSFRKLASLAFFGLIAAGPLAATNHAVQIDEVMPGAFGRKDVQFIEVKFPCGQNFWATANVKLAFFDAAGTETGSFQFPSNPADDCITFTNRSALIGTQAYADLTTGPDPDFIMPAGLLPESGKVCWKGLPAGLSVTMCLTYGNFTGSKDGAGATNMVSPPLAQVCSLRRNRNFFSLGEPSLNADFDLMSPAPTNNAGVTGPVTVFARFADVPASNPFFRFVEAMFNAGVTSGCGNGSYCPGSAVTRDQMAVFLLRSKLGSSFAPPACTTQVFNDVPCSNPFAPWINELAARGITGGCGSGNYCPGSTVTRDQMAVFLLVTKEGTSFSPPACSQVFNDVPCSNPFAPWINELAARGISGGCAAGMFCPGNPVTREQMSVFLSSTFSLPVPTAACTSAALVTGSEETDDHGDTPETATVIFADGTRIVGQLERKEDADYFAFDAEAGDTILIDAQTLGGLFQPLLTVFDGQGNRLADSSFSLAYGATGASAGFVAPATGTFFLKLEPLPPGDTGTYELTVSRFHP